MSEDIRQTSTKPPGTGPGKTRSFSVGSARRAITDRSFGRALAAEALGSMLLAATVIGSGTTAERLRGGIAVAKSIKYQYRAHRSRKALAEWIERIFQRQASR